MSPRQRQEAKKKIAESCACCEDVDADPDVNKYRRSNNNKKRRRKQQILQLILVIAVMISLALAIPILVSKCILSTVMGGEYTEQQRRNLRQSIPIVDPPSSTYHQINVNSPGIKSLTNTTSSYVYAIDNFISEDECNFLIEAAQDCLQPSTVTGSNKGAGRRISTARTSWTCRLHRDDLPILMNSVMKLTNKPLEHIEHPQLARYESTQQFKPHFDAYDEKDPTLKETLEDGGNRLVTILIYLNDVEVGGATKFPLLNIEVQPKRGMAVVFFPATVGGKLDRGALHTALPAVDTKYVSQIWVREGEYVGDVLSGSPDKRLSILEPITERKSWWKFF